MEAIRDLRRRLLQTNFITLCAICIGIRRNFEVWSFYECLKAIICATDAF